jgi:hypothetical protein
MYGSSYDDAHMDVIEIFTFDHEMLGKISKSFYRFISVARVAFSCWLVIAFLLCFLLIGRYCILILLMFYPTLISLMRSERHRRERARIVVSRQCFYIDEVDAPGSKMLKGRIVYRFDEIESCTVKQVETFGHIIFQVIVRNCEGKVILKIEGLRDAQKFVETVSGLLDAKLQPPDGSSVSEINVV